MPLVLAWVMSVTHRFDASGSYSNAFSQTLWQANPITLLVSLNRPLTQATLTLQNDAKAILLTKSPVRVFEQE